MQRYCCLTKYQEQAHYCLPTGSRVRGGNMWELNPQPSHVQGQHNQVHYVARNWINNQLVNNEMLKKHTMTWSLTTTVIVTEFKVQHQAHVHTETFPTLSTQYQILMMIDGSGSAIGFKLVLLLLLLNASAFKTVWAYHGS